MFGLGQTEILVIAGVIIILFGGRKLPEIGAGLGKAISNFKDSYKGEAKKIEPKDENKSEEI